MESSSRSNRILTAGFDTKRAEAAEPTEPGKCMRSHKIPSEFVMRMVRPIRNLMQLEYFEIGPRAPDITFVLQIYLL